MCHADPAGSRFRDEATCGTLIRSTRTSPKVRVAYCSLARSVARLFRSAVCCSRYSATSSVAPRLTLGLSLLGLGAGLWATGRPREPDHVAARVDKVGGRAAAFRVDVYHATDQDVELTLGVLDPAEPLELDLVEWDFRQAARERELGLLVAVASEKRRRPRGGPR